MILAMPDRQEIRAEALIRFLRVANKVHVLERGTRDSGTGELLRLGQWNAVAAVGEHPGLSVTELSDQLGVTKASASEMARKLESSGYVKRTRNPGDARGVSLELTAKGQRARKRHEKLRREMLSTYFRDITFGQVAIFNEILAEIEAFVDMRARGRAGSA